MTKKIFIIQMAIAFVLLLHACSPAETKTEDAEGPQLKFKTDGTFKIAQFTDIHWDPASENNHKTIELIKLILQEEKPDLVIYTGDIVVRGPSENGWLDVTQPPSGSGVPWAVTLGNHDDESDWTRDQIFDLLLTLPHFIGSKGPEEISGTGNYFLPLLSAGSNDTAAVIWCFDSHGYPETKAEGTYDWIKFDQIEWYRQNSQAMTAQNNNLPLPALAYFHIPLPEYKLVAEKEGTVGKFEEDVCSPDINSGMFLAFHEMGDVIGMFVGHEHRNNYIGAHLGIAMGYGQVSGADAYGHFPRGSRIVELKEGQKGFRTWIRTAEGISYEAEF